MSFVSREVGAEITVLYESKNRVAGLTDVSLRVLTEAGVVVVAAAPMTDIGSGWYRRTFIPVSAGHYLAIVDSPTEGCRDAKAHYVGIRPDVDDVFLFYAAPDFVTGLSPGFEFRNAAQGVLQTGSLFEIGSEGVYTRNFGAIGTDQLYLHVDDGLCIATVVSEVQMRGVEVRRERTESYVSASSYMSSPIPPTITAHLEEVDEDLPLAVAVLEEV